MVTKAKERQEVLPAAVDVERLILGSIQVSASSMDTMRGSLDQSDFSLRQHQILWKTFCHLYDTGVPIDRVMTTQELLRAGAVDQVGGLGYLADLEEGLPQFPQFDGYIAVLKDKALQRRVLEIAEMISKRCLLGVDSGEELRESLTQSVAELAAGCGQASMGPISTRQMIDSEGMDKLLQPRRCEGLRLPWDSLNTALCGMHPGQMIVLAGITGRGKTSFALQVATHATRQAVAPVIWTLEMSPKQMFSRIVNQMSNTNSDQARQDGLTPDARSRRSEAAYWLHGHPVWFDRGSHTTGAFTGSVRAAMAKSEVGLAIVDYLQLIRASGRPDSRAREVGENSRALKLAAMDLGIPILVLSQFHRTGDKKATMHSLKESGDIENDADVILLLESGEIDGDNPVNVNVRVAKQREGPAGFAVPLVFHPPSQSFYSSED